MTLNWQHILSTAEAITTASAIAVATAKAVASTIIAEIGRGRKSITAATKRIKTFFAETVALVPPAPTSPVVSHKSVRTLPRCPTSMTLATWATNRTSYRLETGEPGNNIQMQTIAHNCPLCE